MAPGAAKARSQGKLGKGTRSSGACDLPLGGLVMVLGTAGSTPGGLSGSVRGLDFER